MILRFPDNRLNDLELSQGVHALGRDPDGLPGPVDDLSVAIAQICVDRRGVWLQVREGAHGVHVNGRPVRRMAMLRGGDSVYLDGVELQLLGREPAPVPHADGLRADDAGGDRRIVLRGVGGPHHGRCFGLDRALDVGMSADGELRIGAGVSERRLRLQPHEEGTVLHGDGDASCQVNGWPVHEALLRPCDQLLLDAQHRFVVEAPMCAPSARPVSELPIEEMPDEHEPPAQATRSSMKASARRLPWLLLAAVLLSGALALLLLYGAR